MTPQAVYKWANGLSVPSPDKISTLSNLLNASTDWLRYGIDENDRMANLSELDDIFISMFLNLTNEQKKIIVDV
ncbi:helix-turn-helix transcriptional regulator, partial [Avibacterium paragallinarum]|nr:helix-turn-helix transcriptional regulator [Avibacterium paragallinarum]